MKIAHIVTAYHSVITILNSKIRALDKFDNLDVTVISSVSETPNRRHSRNTSCRITYSNVKTAFKEHLIQRHALIKNLVKNHQKLPFCIATFAKMPEMLQYVMLPWWRLRYTTNHMYSLKTLKTYGAKLLGRCLRKTEA